MRPTRQIRMAAARVKQATDHSPEELRDTVVKLTIDNLQLRQKIAELMEERQELLTRIDECEKSDVKQQSTEENENGE